MRLVLLVFFLGVGSSYAVTEEAPSSSTSASCSITWNNPNCTEDEMKSECTRNLGNNLNYCTMTTTMVCSTGVDMNGAKMFGCSCSGHCVDKPEPVPFITEEY
jgi:hypothetical protein